MCSLDEDLMLASMDAIRYRMNTSNESGLKYAMMIVHNIDALCQIIKCMPYKSQHSSASLLESNSSFAKSIIVAVMRSRLECKSVLDLLYACMPPNTLSSIEIKTYEFIGLVLNSSIALSEMHRDLMSNIDRVLANKYLSSVHKMLNSLDEDMFCFLADEGLISLKSIVDRIGFDYLLMYGNHQDLQYALRMLGMKTASSWTKTKAKPRH